MKRILLSILPAIVVTLNLPAQIIQPLDPFINLEDDILTPEQVVKNHVKSCTITINGGEPKTIHYDANGRSYDSEDIFLKSKNFYIYDGKQGVKQIHSFKKDDKNTYNSLTEVKYNEQGKPYRIIKNKGVYEDVTELTYDGDYLVGITSGENSYGNSDGTYVSYNQNGEMDSVLIIWPLVSNADIYIYKNKVPIKKQGLLSADIYNYTDGLLTSIDTELQDNTKKRTVEFTYNDKGLVTKKNDLLNKKVVEYNYTYYSGTKISITSSIDISGAILYNVSQQYDYTQLDIKKGYSSFWIYTPHKELYVLQLNQQLTIPLIVTPRRIVKLYIDNNNITFGPDNKDNNKMIAFEKEKAAALSSIIDQKQQAVALSELIATKIKEETNPSFIGYLYYTQFWNVNKNYNLYKNYSQKVFQEYPYNFKANEAYTTLWKDALPN